ncbi:hypothetical protein DPMN_001888 [Dreissena polymorpha]|uniref:RRM domain-containing protein n=1 Tax=Dreissena polymorpha TaxID=45954 RepID=A0A9D4RTC9_DREPO|nr:hypothetical protein DPMN_001888 [Dreissena polymorpha]
MRGLPGKATHKDIRNFFSPICICGVDYNRREKSGRAIVTFSSKEEAAEALNNNLKIMEEGVYCFEHVGRSVCRYIDHDSQMTPIDFEVTRSKLKVTVLDDELELKLDSLYPKALGFLIIFGLQQIELIGQSIYNYAHACDHEEIQEVLSPRCREEAMPMTVFIRLKCTLTPKGSNVNLKSATFKLQ